MDDQILALPAQTPRTTAEEAIAAPLRIEPKTFDEHVLVQQLLQRFRQTQGLVGIITAPADYDSGRFRSLIDRVQGALDSGDPFTITLDFRREAQQ